MDLTKDLGLSRCLESVEFKLGLTSDRHWAGGAREEFVEFSDWQVAAGYQLPLMMQTTISSSPRLLSDLVDAFKARFDRIASRRASALRCTHWGSSIRYLGAVARVMSEPKMLLLMEGSPSKSTAFFFFRQDQEIDDAQPLDECSKVLEGAIPDKEFWWVSPAEDIQSLGTDVDKLRDGLGLVNYARSDCDRLWLVILHSRGDLRKPCCLDACGQSGFWPSVSSWGQTVDIGTPDFGAGVREALLHQKSPLGKNLLRRFRRPKPRSVDWHLFCKTRAQALDQASGTIAAGGTL